MRIIPGYPRLTLDQGRWLLKLFYDIFPHAPPVDDIPLEKIYDYLLWNTSASIVPEHLRYSSDLALNLPAMLSEQPFQSLVKDAANLKELKFKAERKHINTLKYQLRRKFLRIILEEEKAFSAEFKKICPTTNVFSEKIPDLFMELLLDSLPKAKYNSHLNKFVWDFSWDLELFVFHNPKIKDLNELLKVIYQYYARGKYNRRVFACETGYIQKDEKTIQDIFLQFLLDGKCHDGSQCIYLEQKNTKILRQFYGIYHYQKICQNAKNEKKADAPIYKGYYSPRTLYDKSIEVIFRQFETKVGDDTYTLRDVRKQIGTLTYQLRPQELIIEILQTDVNIYTQNQINNIKELFTKFYVNIPEEAVNKKLKSIIDDAINSGSPIYMVEIMNKYLYKCFKESEVASIFPKDINNKLQKYSEKIPLPLETAVPKNTELANLTLENIKNKIKEEFPAREEEKFRNYFLKSEVQLTELSYYIIRNGQNFEGDSILNRYIQFRQNYINSLTPKELRDFRREFPNKILRISEFIAEEEKLDIEVAKWNNLKQEMKNYYLSY